jgi:hypothetical protein
MYINLALAKVGSGVRRISGDVYPEKGERRSTQFGRGAGEKGERNRNNRKRKERKWRSHILGVRPSRLKKSLFMLWSRSPPLLRC